MSGTVLVTGASGLIGRELVPALRATGREVRTSSRRAAAGVDLAADLAVRTQAEDLLALTRPAVVIHLAGGMAATPEELYRSNVLATAHLLAAAARSGGAPYCIVLGSAAEYGAGGERPIGEDTPARPVSDYGRAKAAQVILARQLAAAGGLPLTVLRPFNVVSPRLPASTALGNMRRQLLSGTGARRRVACGRLDVVRDYVPVSAVVEALRRLVAEPRPGATLNVCSGVGLALGELLEAMAGRLGVVAVPALSPELAALPAGDRVVGDAARLRALLGIHVGVSASCIAELMLAEA